MTFWLEKGWLRYKPSRYGPALNFIGSPTAPIEDQYHGGFRRINGFGPGWLDLLTLDYTPWRLSFSEQDFEESMRLEKAV